MLAFEDELKKFEPVIKRLSNIALLGKKIAIKGRDNFIKSGPNIIVGNHIGTFKDIAILFRIVPRPIFFTANRMIFEKEEFNFLIKKHLRRHLKLIAPAVELFLNPLKSYLVNYVSTNIGKIGTIPVDIYQRKKLAIQICQDYLRKGRAIIALQGRGRIIKSGHHPYVSPFRRGVAIMAYNLWQEGIEVPVTPVAMFGTHRPLLIPSKVKVNVGQAMYISEFIKFEFSEAINKFKEALERRVKILLAESFSY
ncbi:MAG: lysophospholipid acyltransferase family protein [Candidatus Aminicenantales bacterium]